MSLCPLCNSSYPSGTLVCAIDGTKLGIETDSTGLAPMRVGLTHDLEHQGNRARGSVSPAGKRGSFAGASLSSIDDDEVTTAAQPEALARAARGEMPPRIAKGSGTAAPESEERNAWSTPFVEPVPTGAEIGANDPESWLGKSLGAYKLISILGKGGMGCVYLAEHKKLGREVALKVLRADYAQRKDAVARFFQEARAVNKIRHRNIVDITDFLELDTGVVFIIMEYLDGVPLTNLMKAQSGIEPVRALGLLIQICDGLAAAHSVSIVHRDLKPDNILVVRDHQHADLVKVLDFGVAKLLEKTDGDDLGLETVAGSVVGTPAFMSPEQAGGMSVDGRADLYSLGAIMYEIFTKQPLFTGKSFGEFVRKHLTETPRRPSETHGGKNIEPQIEAIILRCTAKEPKDRFATAQELKLELLAALSNLENRGEMTKTSHQLASEEETIDEKTMLAISPGVSHPVGGNSGIEAPYSQGPQYPAQDSATSHRLVTGDIESQAYPLVTKAALSAANVAALRESQHAIRQDGEAATQLATASFPLESKVPQPPPLPALTTPSTPDAQPPPQYPTPQFPTPLPQGNPAPQSGVSYPLVPNAGYGGALQSTIQEGPLRRNYKGVGIATGIAVISLVALIARCASDEDSEKLAETEAVDGDVNNASKPGPQASRSHEAARSESQRQDENSESHTQTGHASPIVVIQMSSTPSAQIFAVGDVVAKGETPFELRINTTDGGDIKTRDFILKADQYQDARITIDLENPPKSIPTTLVPVVRVEADETKPGATKKKFTNNGNKRLRSPKTRRKNKKRWKAKTRRKNKTSRN